MKNVQHRQSCRSSARSRFSIGDTSQDMELITFAGNQTHEIWVKQGENPYPRHSAVCAVGEWRTPCRGFVRTCPLFCFMYHYTCVYVSVGPPSPARQKKLVRYLPCPTKSKATRACRFIMPALHLSRLARQRSRGTATSKICIWGNRRRGTGGASPDHGGRCAWRKRRQACLE